VTVVPSRPGIASIEPIFHRAEGVTYACRGRGALLSLPCGGLRQVVIQTKIFEKYAGEHAASWFHWSKVRGLPIKRMEDLVLICGCTLVTSWAAVAFDDSARSAQVSLASRTLKNGGASFVWNKVNGTVERHDSQLDPVCFSLLVYVILGTVVLTFFFPL
jgi:hypothetical protein